MTDKEYYFISGLPRSGSTLLSAILRQNPDFYADISSPVQGMLTSAIGHMSTTEASPNITDHQRDSVLKGMVDGYYSNIEKPVIFDSSRGWTSQTNLLKAMYPYTRIICCVRDINWILDSFEKISNVIKPWYWLQEGLLANPSMILLVEYNDLTQKPEETMRRVYDFIGMDYYESHDYENVEYSNDPFDLKISTPDLHTVSGRVEYRERETILPQQILDKYSGYEFWRQENNNGKKNKEPTANLLYS